MSCEFSGQELQICPSRTAIESNRSICDAHLVSFLAKSYKNAYPKSCTHTLEKWFEKTRPFVWGAHKVCSSLCSPNEDAWENEQAIFCNHATLLQKIIKDQIQRNPPLRYLQSIYPPNGVSFPSALKEFPPPGHWYRPHLAWRAPPPWSENRRGSVVANNDKVT